MFPEPEWFDALRTLVAGDRELAAIGRCCTLGFVVRVGAEVFLIRLREGKIEDVVTQPDMDDSWSFTLAGSREDWRSFLQETPPPFYNDLLAMNTRVPTFSIEGDRHAFVRHLRTIKRVFRIAQVMGAYVGARVG